MSSTLLAVVLQQKKTLVDYVGDDSVSVLYMAALPDGDNLPLRVLIPLDEYEALGQPEQLTVTIRPGSHFDDLDSAFQTTSTE